MASLPTSATLHLSTLSPASNSNSFACAFQGKRPLLPYPAKRRPPQISCKASDEHERQQIIADTAKLDRRDVLIGLCGAAASLGVDGKTLANPIQTPDFSTCHHPNDLPRCPMFTECCPPPYSGTIKDFQRPSSSSPLRVRRAAHLLDADYVAKYKKAVELMRALPADDPRNFTQQANVHCAYCNGALDQIGSHNLQIQVHDGWLFFPFHRFYLYFHERILGKLIGDETFALPFWNWDAPGGMKMPSFYTDPSSSLYDKLRDSYHLPPTLVDLDYNKKETTLSPADLIKSNLSTMYRHVVVPKKAQSFMGDPYRAGDEHHENGAGALERVPHNTLHVWIGDGCQPNGEDMGNFYSAGRDPIFYGHHANVDRMWDLWIRLGGKRRNFHDEDWLNASFLFYDENCDLVRVFVKDCLDPDWLRYSYQDVVIPWFDSRPTPKVAVKGKKGKKAVPEMVKFPVILSAPVSATVKRPKVSRSSKEKEETEEVLIVEGIELDSGYYIKFDVLVNATEADRISPVSSEFAGSFVHVPHTHKRKDGEEEKMKTQLSLSISELLEDIGAEGDDSLVVTIVPKAGKGLVSVGGLKIDFLK